MKIKLDDTEWDCYDYLEEIKDDTKVISFRIDVSTEELRDSLKEILKRKYPKFTKETDASFNVSVKNHSYSYSLRDKQSQPDHYTFFIELEEFDKEAELNKLIKKVTDNYGMGLVAHDFSIALKELLIEKKIFTKEEWKPKVSKVEKETKELIRKIVEKELDKRISP